MLDFLKTFPTHMDFEGQKLAEKIFQLIIAASAVIGFAVGNYNQRFSYTVYILGIGFVLCCLVTLPPWSFYRKHPLSWLKAVVLVEENAEGNASQQKTKQKKK